MFTHRAIVNVLATLALLGAPVSARRWAGSVDMNQACSVQYGGGWTASCGACSSSNDWGCYDAAGNAKAINVDAYCAQTYGNAAYADPQGGGAYDWGCYWYS